MTDLLDTPAGRIGYDVEGEGPPLILVAGAFQFRAFDPDTTALAVELARRGLMVINYDRPGRGESAAEPPLTLDGEIEVLRAFTDEFGPAALYGSSSGAAICLAAAAAGLPVTRLVLWEAPIGGDDATDGYSDLEAMRKVLATGDLEQSVLLFMKDMPEEWREGARQGPAWPTMCAMAPSLEPDVESIARSQSAPRGELWSDIAAPALVLIGEQTLPIFVPSAESITAALGDARLERVAGAGHRWELDAMADKLARFLLPG